MENILPILKICPLFAEIAESNLLTMLNCLSAAEKHFEKKSFIFTEDQSISSVGIVLSGSVHIIQEDFWGNRTILTRLEAGDLFGEAFSCAEMRRLPASALAMERSEILLIDYRKVVTTCSTSCVFHTQLIKNMLKILANKNIMLTQKIEYITKRSTREKVLSYLSTQAQQAGRNVFTIPFNRQEMADYLAVDRSALSHELSKMQNENILRFERRQFELIHPYSDE